MRLAKLSRTAIVVPKMYSEVYFMPHTTYKYQFYVMDRLCDHPEIKKSKFSFAKRNTKF